MTLVSPLRRMLAGGALALLLALPASARAVGPPVRVFPIPGSRLASPRSQIAFRGIPASQIGQISVTGSATGAHPGVIAADSDGQGGSFLPTTPFQPGETVFVSTSLNIVRGSGGVFSFRIVTPAGPIPFRKAIAAPRVSGDVSRYHSRPDLSPAAVRITRRTSRTAPGDIFLAPQLGPLQNGPMILDPTGGLVWFKPVAPNDTVTDFRVQQYLGQPVLTWWEGNQNAGTGRGVGLIYNTAYRQIAVVHAANGLAADLHEFDISRNNTAWITSFFPVIWDTTSIKGGNKHAIVLDGVVQEIDIPTGLVLYQWDSLDHVPLSDTVDPYPKHASTPFDYFHVNSIDQDVDGDPIISARNTSTIYKLDYTTGAVVWRLGGKHSSFKLGPGMGTVRQHSAQILGGGLLALFDNGGGPPRVHGQSRGMITRLDTTHMTATLVRQVEHTPRLASNFEGNLQLLPNGDSFLGWGQQPYFSEYDSRGQLQFDGHFVDSNVSYRAYRFPWNGSPPTLPAAAGQLFSNSTLVWASYNGATAVASWRVLGGSSASSLQVLNAVPKRGFETAARIRGRQRFVEVQALDAQGNVIASSLPTATH